MKDLAGVPPVPHSMVFGSDDLDIIVYALCSVGNTHWARCGDLANRIIATGVAQVKDDQRNGEASYANL